MHELNRFIGRYSYKTLTNQEAVSNLQNKIKQILCKSEKGELNKK